MGRNDGRPLLRLILRPTTYRRGRQRGSRIPQQGRPLAAVPLATFGAGNPETFNAALCGKFGAQRKILSDSSALL